MRQTSTNRRRFLKTGCLTVGAAGLTLCGLSVVAPNPPRIEETTYTYGGDNMKERILIAYATYAGSTAEVAAAIGETLSAHGASVKVQPISDHPQIDGYQAVLIGSAVQHGNWLPEAVEFVKANQGVLNRVPVALFCVHIQNTGDDEQSRKNRLAYLDQVRALLQPVAEGFFAGKFDRRGAALLLPGMLARLVPPLDFRNWKKIRAWSNHVHPMLLQVA
jgi:menaquinone-dependent protoporphyrinogen oxidase